VSKDSINADLSGVNNLPSRFRRGQKAAGNQAMMQMHNYIPRKNNHLRDSQTLSMDGKTISYHEPYAKAQFYGFINGYRIHNYTEPGTSRRWDLRLKGNEEKMNNVKKSFIEGAELNGPNR